MERGLYHQPGGEFLGTYRPIFAQNQSIEGALHLPNLIFASSTSLWEAMESLEGFVGDAVPVIDDDKKLVAVVTEADIITAYMDIIHQIQQEERASI
ncbi:hypothetical protein CS022_10855 [Veronia nyctiphanis]|uniref:CBS domain-containing protein n=1 Tax=Veronia nyctiphanis TaxID=1278244 RepID=A0A4Q0YSX4_9GAMM|nr:CBS domain-containing protein [Veronia nyctiphanis]RXJ73234.1 hypothetical protein CS022_10855 [Veronia nyctiphanis]